jgi:hypothetical protein
LRAPTRLSRLSFPRVVSKIPQIAHNCAICGIGFVRVIYQRLNCVALTQLIVAPVSSSWSSHPVAPLYRAD